MAFRSSQLNSKPLDPIDLGQCRTACPEQVLVHPAAAGSAQLIPETAKHLVQSYELELTQLRQLVVQMGGLVEEQVASATKAILEGDADAATQAGRLIPELIRWSGRSSSSPFASSPCDSRWQAISASSSEH